MWVWDSIISALCSPRGAVGRVQQGTVTWTKVIFGGTWPWFPSSQTRGDEEIQLVSIIAQLNPLQGDRDSKEVSWQSPGVLLRQVLCPSTVSEAQTAVDPKGEAVLFMHGMSWNRKAGMCPDNSTSFLQAYKDQKTSPVKWDFLYGTRCWNPGRKPVATRTNSGLLSPRPLSTTGFLWWLGACFSSLLESARGWAD